MLVPSTDFKSIAVPCTTCGCHQAGVVRGSYSQSPEEEMGHAGRQFFLVQCPICGSPFLAYVDWSYAGDSKFVIDPPGTLFPDSGDHFDVAVPPDVSESLREAIRAIGVGAPTAAAIMCRRTLELICKDVVGPELEAKQAEEAEARKNAGKPPKKPRQPGLGEMLSALKDKIDPRLHEWSDTVVRELGNSAAHSKAIETEDAYDALEFTRALVQNHYVLQRSFEQFKERRDKRKASA